MDEGMENMLRSIRRTAALRPFLAHFAVFTLVLLVALILRLHRDSFWPLLGWTIGLVLHGLAAVGPGQFIGARWEAARLRQLLEDRAASFPPPPPQ